MEKTMRLSENELADLIRLHNRLYWEKGEPEISDEDFDALVRRLEEVNPDNPLLNAVNAPVVASSGKVAHSRPMLSLDKAYSLEEVVAWAKKYARSEGELFLVQPKYDGISANFSGGVLATRGDGVNGENISDKLPLIELEAKGRRGPVDRPVRGEIVIRDDDFRTLYSHIKKKDGKPYKNSRNAVAGIMGLKEIDDMVAQGAKLTLVDYELHSRTVRFDELPSRWPGILEEVEALPYPMDGLVIKLADEAYRDSLGSTAHHPRGMVAFKFSGVRKKTRLLDVEWGFGKKAVSPVAILEPVEIGGITIKRASLHNIQIMIDKDIHVGDIVVVERAGDVIPHIVSAEPGEHRRPALISKCPCCGSELARVGPELRCSNRDCFETRLQKILASVRNIGIEHLGEPNIRKMMKALGVAGLKDIFGLKVTDILRLDGFKEKSATNLYREIQNARRVADHQVLAALNIGGIGKTVAKSILSAYSLDELRRMGREQLSSIDGIGPERAAALETELREQAETLDEILACVELTPTKGGARAGMPTICFTGKMPEKRGHYEDLARQRGYEPVDSVTSDLAVLVAADTAGGSSKLEKARKAGTIIMSLDEWLASPDPAPAEGEPRPQQAGEEKKTSYVQDDLF